MRMRKENDDRGSCQAREGGVTAHVKSLQNDDKKEERKGGLPLLVRGTEKEGSSLSHNKVIVIA